MRPKEKAKELVNKIYVSDMDSVLYGIYKTQAKKCALITVDEILNLMIKEFKWDVRHNGNIDYWLQVKQEIENL